MVEANSGLEGVLVADTMLSDVDGEHGRLILAGEDVEQLAGTVPFDAVCRRLWQAAGLTDANERAVRDALAAARVLAFERLSRLGDARKAPDGMEALRGMLGQLFDIPADGLQAAASVTGAAATFVAAWWRT